MKHIMSMTYEPKIKSVFSGECAQTIRLGDKFKEGDEILIHTWSGKPYRSSWGNRLKVLVVLVRDVLLWEECIAFKDNKFWGIVWGSKEGDELAMLDGVIGGGEGLKETLKELNGIETFEGQNAQIIRWREKLDG